MLTKDLLRYRIRDGRCQPQLLKATPAVLDLAARLLAHWREGVGQRRGDLEEAAVPLLHESRSALMAKGLQKLVCDACAFADPASAEELRARALAASATRLRAPAASAEAHLAAVAADCGQTAAALAEGLYADLPDLARLQAAPAWTAEDLLARYNLALCQGLLLRARSLAVHLPATDTGGLRRLAKALRFRRLLATITRTDGEALLEISGPTAVLDQGTRYGLQLAQFLPELAACRRWRAEADLAPTRAEDGDAVLDLSDATGLAGAAAWQGHVPDELKAWLAQLEGRLPGRRLDLEPEPIGLPSGELVVPDLAIDGIPVELFHRWHGAALARRLAAVGRPPLARLALGVDRALAKTTAVAPLLADPAFARHGFLFSDLPSATALAEVAGRLDGIATPG